MDKNKTVNKVSLFIVSGNILLTVLKFLAGIFGPSSAMISDAIHSLSDVAVVFVVWLGAKLSLRQFNGYKNAEYIASLFLGAILLLTCFCIGVSGLKSIIYSEKTSPDIIALIMAAVSILIKEIMYHYVVYYAKILDSCAFLAEAWHQRTDTLASVCTLTGIGAAMLGFPIFETIASLIISFFILKVSYQIMKSSITKLREKA